MPAWAHGRRLSCIALAVFAVSFGCGPRGPAAWPGRNGAQLRTEASKDLSCAPSRLSQENVYPYVHRVERCGKSRVYIYDRTQDLWSPHPRQAHLGPPSPRPRPSTSSAPAPPLPRRRLTIDASGASTFTDPDTGAIMQWFKPLKPCSERACTIAMFKKCPNGPRFLLLPKEAAIAMQLNRRICDLGELDALRLVEGSDAEQLLERLRNDSCCRVCESGSACGHSCIPADRECHQEPGCAC